MPFNSIFSWIMKKRLHQIELFQKYPIDVQDELLRKHLFNGSFTEYGKKYGFREIENYSQFKERVPLQTYEDLQPWVERLMKGEKALLWPTDTRMFAKSSGTTSNRSKYIPVTRESMEDCHQRGGKDLLALYYWNNPNAKLYNYKHLVVGGSAKNIQLSEETYAGDLSALLMKNMPWWAEIRRTPTRDTALLEEWEEKIARIALEAYPEDVALMVGVPSWTLVILKRILDITGKDYITDIWPNLECFMHGGVSFAPYKDQFAALMNKSGVNYMESYNASEGFFGIQDQLDNPSLLLMLDYGIYYEFIPMEHYAGKDSKVVQNLEEVEVGKQYALVISTNGGLWRYIIGDTIRFTEKEPYRFVIAGRTRSFINAFGEELIVENADKAIAYASSQTGAQIRDYTAAPVFMENKNSGGHEWAIEFDVLPADLDQFIRMLDTELMRLNSDYEAKRSHDYIMKEPKVNVLPRGTFEDWLRRHDKLGGQNKIPRLNNGREFLDQILQQVRV